MKPFALTLALPLLLAAGPALRSSPDLGKAEGRCRPGESGPALLVEALSKWARSIAATALTGAYCVWNCPSPRRPRSLLPQHLTPPAVVTAQVNMETDVKRVVEAVGSAISSSVRNA